MDKKVRMGDQPWISCLVDSYFFVSFLSLSLFLMRRWHNIFGIILYCRCTDCNSRPVSRFFAYVDIEDPRNEVRRFTVNPFQSLYSVNTLYQLSIFMNKRQIFVLRVSVSWYVSSLESFSINPVCFLLTSYPYHSEFPSRCFFLYILKHNKLSLEAVQLHEKKGHLTWSAIYPVILPELFRYGLKFLLSRLK